MIKVSCSKAQQKSSIISYLMLKALEGSNRFTEVLQQTLTSIFAVRRVLAAVDCVYCNFNVLDLARFNSR